MCCANGSALCVRWWRKATSWASIWRARSCLRPNAVRTIPTLLRNPDPASVEELLAAGEGAISMITMAPELPGAVAAMARFRAEGVRVAFGHSDADAMITEQALAAGVTVVTHLFNAMRPIHHRDPGPIPMLLTSPLPVLEMISDGFHLHPDVLLMIIAAAGTRSDRVDHRRLRRGGSAGR